MTGCRAGHVREETGTAAASRRAGPAGWAVLDGIRHGMSRRQIAARRGVSSYAIRYHARNIARKIGAAGVPELRHGPGIPAASAIGPGEGRM